MSSGTVVRSSRTATFVNPVVRYDGVRPLTLAASVDGASTWALRGGYILAAGAALLAVFRKRRSRETARAAVGPALSRAGRERAS